MLNADPAELEKFGDLAHRWWDPNSEFKPLHDINPLRLGWIDRCVSLRGKQVLDRRLRRRIALRRHGALGCHGYWH